MCKVPINTTDINSKFPCQADSSGLVIVKIKTKLAYRGHVYFEQVRPYIINQLLQYLKSNNEFYSDIEVDMSHIPSSLIEEINLNHVTPVEVDWSD